jgi:hypothetical protein
MQQMDRLVL